MSFPGDNKLTLNENMTGSYLIQRLQKPYQFNVEGKEVDNPFSFGGGFKNGGLTDDAMSIIRNIFSFDYMGSAEFEFGAVPQALQFIASQASKNNLVHDKVTFIKNEFVYYISPLEYEEEVVYRIGKLRRDESEFRLKERCGLKNYFEGKNEYDKNNCGWLELNNGFMFFSDKEMYSKVCKLFGMEVI